MFKNTFFKKYMLINFVVIVISFITLGIMVIVFMLNYWEDQKHKLLSENAESISTFIKKNLKESGTELQTIDTPLTKIVLDRFSKNIDADIFITDENGVIMLLSSRAQNNLSIGQQIPPCIVGDALGGGYNGKGNLSGTYKDSCYFVGVPIIINETEVGIVFASTDTEYISNFRIYILSIFFIAALISFIVAFLLIGILSYSMIQPLKLLTKVAHNFGRGDLLARVEIKNNDEIGELAKEFNNMADSIEDSEKVRRSFISNVSHELKTPITSICGVIDAILDGTIQEEKRDYYLKIVSDESKRLSRLVTSMINLSRIDNNQIKLNKSEFNITPIIISILISFEQKIASKNVNVINLDKIDEALIYADKDMIYQVIYNLVENSVKFVESGGYIYVNACENGDNVSFTIKNSGIGISNEEIKYIFDKFYKTDKSRSQDKKSIGLGLYICKTIIKRHGGEISINSVENKYCEFNFWIPKK